MGSDNVNYAQVTNYHPTGKMQRLVHGNGVETNYTYDVESTRITKIVTSRGAGIYMNRDYLYSPAGDIERLTDTDNVIYEYSYDSLHRLTSEISSKPLELLPSVLGFKHDNVSGPVHAPSAVKVNANPGADYTYAYDKNGNQNSGPNLMNVADVKDRSLTYNADNMPVKVESSGALLAEFVYDGEGKRAKKQSGSKTNIYINQYFEIVDGVVTKYVFAGNLRVAVIKNGQVTYLHKDHLGSSTVTSDVNGNKQEITAYLPFGLTHGTEKIAATHYTFTDQEIDFETGLFNYDARLYDPVIGRFVSADTIVPEVFDSSSLNRYTYCKNNPMIYTDPDGHIANTIAGAIGGGAIGLAHGVFSQIGGSSEFSWKEVIKSTGYGMFTGAVFTSTFGIGTSFTIGLGAGTVTGIVDNVFVEDEFDAVHYPWEEDTNENEKERGLDRDFDEKGKKEGGHKGETHKKGDLKFI